MKTRDQQAAAWTLILRRQDVPSVAAQPQAGDAQPYELICIDCGDHPNVTYRDASPELQQVRGPYLFAAAAAAFEQHVQLHERHYSPLRPHAALITDRGSPDEPPTLTTAG